MTDIIISKKDEALIPESDLETVRRAIRDYVNARSIVEEAKGKADVLIAAADDALFPILAGNSIEKLKFPGAGSITYREHVETRRFDKETLQISLLEQGVSATVISKAMTAADKISSIKDYVITFRKESKKSK
jgi:hypothetical protein